MSRRGWERVLMWGGALVVCVVVGQLGAHPAGAAGAGLAAALVIGGMLSARSPR